MKGLNTIALYCSC